MQNSNRPTSKDFLAAREERVRQYGNTPNVPDEDPSPTGVRWLVAALIVLLAAIIMVVAAAGWGYLDGTRDRKENMRTQALDHYRLGVQHLEAGELELAQAEFEETVRLQPELSQAWDHLQEIQIRLASVPTPTSVPLPTHTPQASATPALADLQTWLKDAETLNKRGDFEGAIERAQRILTADSSFEPKRVSEVLFNSSVQQAKSLVDEDRLEEAVRLFDQALLVRPQEAGVRLERDLVADYSTALSYVGANWEKAALAFEDLFQREPRFKDISSRYYESALEHANQLAQVGLWCDANLWLEKALQMRSTSDIVALRDQMADYCERNVPPPTPAIDPSVTVTVTLEAPAEEGTPIPASVSSEALKALGLQGSLYYSVMDTTLREYVLYRVNANGAGTNKVFVGMHQPQINHAGTQIIARARSSVKTLGLYLIDLSSSTATQMTSHVDDLYATFSPDDKQILFTSNRMSQRLWSLSTTWLDGKSELTTVTQGQTPAWGPSGMIAFKGCDESANNCGIYLVAPDGSGRTHLVADPSAGFPTWSPDGSQIAYMSNRDGNWAIYAIGTDGQGLRRLTHGAGSEGLPAWSPDGRGIAYLSDQGGGWGIYIQRLDNGQAALLTPVETVYEDWMMEKITWGPALSSNR